MKKQWLVVAGAVILLAVVLGMSGCGESGLTGTLELSGNLNNQQEGIWVSGTGKVYATPDVAILSLGIESQEVSVAEAQANAAAAMADVMQALEDQGIAEEDIQTQYFSIREVTQWEPVYNGADKETVIGYEVTNTVSVKVREVTQAGAVIDAVVAAGGDLTRVNGITFTVEDPTDYYADAREQAAAYAQAKAEQLADLTGVELGEATYVSESSSYGSPNYYRGDAFLVEEAAAPTPISVGTLEITATVQIAYAVK
jgi:uncharacterized protein YggE